MPTSTHQPEERARRAPQPPTRPTPPLTAAVPLVAPTPLPTGRGTQGVRQAAIQRLQATLGNRATRRALARGLALQRPPRPLRAPSGGGLALQRVKLPNKIPGKYPLDKGRLPLTLAGTKVNITDGQYNFVVMDEGIFVSQTSGHPMLAGGAPVEYAGMLYVTKEELVAWNNHSGHYEPPEDVNDQAGFPKESFSTWQQWEKGGWPHLRNHLVDDRPPFDFSTLKGTPIPLNKGYERLEEDENADAPGTGQNKLCPGCTIL